MMFFLLQNEKTEIHHLILNTLGGPDNEANGVCLTASEHCMVHLGEELDRLGAGKGTLHANILAAGGGTGNTPANQLGQGQENRNRLKCVADVTVEPKTPSCNPCNYF